jgi:hypothetical protein
LTFFSLAECNEAIALVMRRMNDRPMRNLGLSRREMFEKVGRDALNALPADVSSSVRPFLGRKFIRAARR